MASAGAGLFKRPSATVARRGIGRAAHVRRLVLWCARPAAMSAWDAYASPSSRSSNRCASTGGHVGCTM